MELLRERCTTHVGDSTRETDGRIGNKSKSDEKNLSGHANDQAHHPPVGADRQGETLLFKTKEELKRST
jgi:hypothetical protein